MSPPASGMGHVRFLLQLSAAFTLVSGGACVRASYVAIAREHIWLIETMICSRPRFEPMLYLQYINVGRASEHEISKHSGIKH
jgi:hypothetical protein